jgi:hypothetical protein
MVRFRAAVVAVLGPVCVLAGCTSEVSGKASPVPQTEICAVLTPEVHLRTDAGMHRIETTLRGRGYDVALAETKLQAYERFKKLFKDRPDLIATTHPEDMPAGVAVRPPAGTDRPAWLAELTTLARADPDFEDITDPFDACLKTTGTPLPPH